MDRVPADVEWTGEILEQLAELARIDPAGAAEFRALLCQKLADIKRVKTSHD